MALANYDQLVETITAYLKGRNDLADRIPVFVGLAEKRLFRDMRVREMEKTVTLTAAASITLPEDFLEARTLIKPGDPSLVIEQVTPESGERAWPFNYTGEPRLFSVEGGNLFLHPGPDGDYSLTLKYWAQPLSLGPEQQTNALFPVYSDAYLFASLLEAAVYLFDDERQTTWSAKLNAALALADRQDERAKTGKARARRAYGGGVC